jgi:hypothetical protein
MHAYPAAERGAVVGEQTGGVGVEWGRLLERVYGVGWGTPLRGLCTGGYVVTGSGGGVARWRG